MEFLATFITWADQLPPWVAALTALVTGATAITMLTPTKTDDKILDTILAGLNFVAGNFLRNKNEDSE